MNPDQQQRPSPQPQNNSMPPGQPPQPPNQYNNQQQYQQGPPQYQGQQPGQGGPPSSEKATAAIVLSIIGVATAVFAPIGLVVSVVALVLSIIALNAKKQLAVVALGLSIIGLVASLLILPGFIAGFQEGFEESFQEAISENEEDSGEESARSDETDEIEPESYPESVRQAFIDNCVLSGGNVETCTCALEGVEQRLTFSEYTVLERELEETDVMPARLDQVFDEAVEECV